MPESALRPPTSDAPPTTWFQRLLLLTIALTFVLVVVGGTVRATDSGLGCPDWPTCHGRLVPKAEKHTLIEFSHRTLAAAVGVVFLGVTWSAFKTERRRPLVFWLAFSAGVLLAAQIALGGITVKRDLPAGIVAAHLATAMAFIGVLIVTATASYAASFARSRGVAAFAGARDSAYTRMALLAAATAFVTLVLGSYISGTEASLACDGWPLCNGSIAPSGSGDVGLHWLHRLVAGLLGLFVLALIYLAFEERRRQPLLVALSIAAGVVYVAQALVGAANIWTELAAGVVVLHLSLAALLWCMMVGAGALSYYLRGGALDAEAVEDAEARGAEQGKVATWAR